MMEIETFWSWAMCISVLGKMSAVQLFYVEEMRIRGNGKTSVPVEIRGCGRVQTGEYLPVHENERGTYIFKLKTFT